MPSGVRQVSLEASPPASLSARARQSSSDFRGNSPSATGPIYLCACGRLRSGAGVSAGLGERALGVGILRSSESGPGLGHAGPSDVTGAVVEAPVRPVRGTAATAGGLAPAAGPCRSVDLDESKLRTHARSIAAGYDRYSAAGACRWSQAEVAADGRRHGEAEARRSARVHGAAVPALRGPGRSEVHAVVGPDDDAPVRAAVVGAF